MSLESGLNIAYTILQADAHVLVALVNPLHEQIRDPKQLVLARFPHADHNSPRGNACTDVFGRSLF